MPALGVGRASLQGGPPSLIHIATGGHARIRLGLSVGGLHRHRTTFIVRAVSDEDTPEVPSELLADLAPEDVPKPKISKVKSARKPRKTPIEGVERKPRVKKEVIRPTFDDMSMADFQELWIRLCENDVEYNEMKNMCSSNELGGKDMKYKLRAKLIKQVGERLGKPSWSKANYGPNFKYPNKMTERDLSIFFDDREIVMPDEYDEAVGFAFAIMVQDGVIDPAKVPISLDYDNKNTEDLKRICKERGLPQTGNKAELTARLMQHDQEMDRQRRAIIAKSAAVLEKLVASIDMPPMPPNSALAQKLQNAVDTAAAIGTMTLPELRITAYARGLPVYGTVEALQDRIMEVLRREAVEAHAGKDRLLRYAEAAVAKLEESEVLEALAMRGIARKTLSGPEEEATRLVNTLVDEWLHNALQPPMGASLDGMGGDDDFDDGIFAEEYEDEGTDSDADFLSEGEEVDVGASAGGAEVQYDEGGDVSAVQQLADEEDWDSSEEDEVLGGTSVLDPTIDVVLLCTGATQAQREASLAAARVIVPQLQSDVLWGTLNPAAEQDSAVIVDGSATGAATVPPTQAVDIFCLEPLAQGVLMRLDCPLVPAGTWIVVTATPCDGEEGAATVVKECRAGDAVPLQGLSPGTGYEFTARLRNTAGDGPEAEPYLAATPLRQGVAVHVAYTVPAASPFAAGEETKYVSLSWEQLYTNTVEVIDAQLRAGGAAAAKSFSEIAPEGTVVLPLGPPIVDISSTGAEVAFVGSWASSEMRQLVTSRPAFAAAARELGYEAVDLLELTPMDFSTPESAELKLLEWMNSRGFDPLVTRVAVRVEAVGDVVAAGIGRGLSEILQGAAQLLQNYGAPSVVLEAVPPAAVYFSCGVVAGPEGVVALPPTEISYVDYEEDFFAMDIELEKFYAVTAGQDADKVAALVAMEKESRKLPPGALGGLPLPTQRAAHSTPPASLPAGVAENIRLAAAKLFHDLGLKDFARFSGWVVPEDPLEEAGLSAAQKLLHAAAEIAKNGNGNGSNGAHANGAVKPAPKSFAEMQALHEAEQAILAAEGVGSSSGTSVVSQLDKDAAVDIQDYAFAADEEEQEVAMANLPVLREAGEGAERAPVIYGTFAGIALDNRTREELLANNPPPPVESIPVGQPVVEVPTALPALGEMDAGMLCRAVPGRRIAFSQVDVSLTEVGDRLGVLAQQSAAAGLSLSTLPRKLVSVAAARAGLPPLAPPAEDPPEGYFMEEEEPLPSVDLALPSEVQEHPVSFEDIGAQVTKWEWERSHPPPPEENDESYDAIRNAAEVEELEAERSAAGAGLPDIGADDVIQGTGDVPYPPYFDDFMGADSPVGDLRRDFPGLHPTRQRVWVLCGGEGPQRDESLEAAVNAAAALQNEQDLLIETFFLDPYDAGVGEADRRRTLLQRRLDLLKIGATDDNLLEDCPEFHPTRIKHPTPPDAEDLGWRGVWRLGSTHVVKSNVPDLKEGCEEVLQAGTTAWLNRQPNDVIHRQQTLLTAAKKELELAGLVPGGPAPWGGYLERSGLPEYSFLKDWVIAAQEQCVVVLLALPGHPIVQGSLQRLLESHQVPFTGPASIGAELCADRPELLRMLGNEPPFHSLSLPELAAKCESEASADDFHSRLFGGWEGKILSIRPARACGGLGVMHAASGRDLQIYYAAIREWADVIPAELLEGEDQDVRMPVPPPTQFIIEPASKSVWLTLRTDAEVGAGGNASAVAEEQSLHAGRAMDPLAAHLTWPPKDPEDRWLEVKACLLGSAGSMRTLSLTATVLQTQRNAETGDDEVVGSFELTPIPPTILHPDKALEAKLRLQQIADTAGLSGAAQITALVDTSKDEVCEVIVREVEPHPALTPEGLLMRQAAAAPSPLSPTEVLRELLKVGMSREGGMEIGELSWLGGGMYDMGASSLGAQSEMSGAGVAHYWGDDDVEIEPAFLGLSEDDILGEIERQTAEERRRKMDEDKKRREQLNSEGQ